MKGARRRMKSNKRKRARKLNKRKESKQRRTNIEMAGVYINNNQDNQQTLFLKIEHEFGSALPNSQSGNSVSKFLFVNENILMYKFNRQNNAVYQPVCL